MTPTLKTVARTFEEVANKRKIDLTKIDVGWLRHMMGGTQFCDFKTKKIFLDYVNMVMDKAESNFCFNRLPNASKPMLADEGCETNPYLLTGDELKRTEDARKRGDKF